MKCSQCVASYTDKHEFYNIDFRWKTSLILLLISFAAIGETTKKRVCIVGAGVSGLVAAKYLSEYPNEFEIVVFEKNSDAGGLWIYTDSTTVDEHGLPVHSSIYKSLQTTGIKDIAAFPDYPELGDESLDGRFFKHEVLLAYLRNYTDNFNLRQYIQFNTNVEKIKPLSHLRWLAITRNLNNEKISKTTCDFVVVCNGHYFKGYVPKIEGIESFKGQLLHSHVYRRPEPFSNQTVVVLGASDSGTDISIDISSLARKVYLSHRHDSLSGVFPSNLEQVPGVVGAEDGKLILSNGTKISADALIFATGYVYDYPFLDESSDIIVVEDGKYIRSIYKHLINIERPTMAFIGVAVEGLAFRLIHAQVNYLRAVLRGKLSLPSSEQMLLETEIAANSTSRKGHITSFDEFFEYHDELILEADGKPLPWWTVAYVDKLQELRSGDWVHYKEKKFVIHEANRTVEFV